MTRRVPDDYGDLKEWLRKVASAVNSMLEGRVNSSGVATLTNGAATTVITDRRIGNDSVVLFMPLTANAAAEQAAGTMYVKTTDIAPRNVQFTINHANNAQTDRNFRYVILGSEQT